MSYPSVAYHLQGATLGLRPIAETSDTQWHPYGTQALAQDSSYGVAQFLYLAGCALTEPGDVVRYNLKTGATVRVVHGGATSTGPLAVAMSANVAGQNGWYAVFGAVPVNAATVAADAPLYLTSTAGQLDDAVVSGDKISGIISLAATSAGFATCQLAYPEVTAEASSTGILKVTLTAAVEAADAIVVSGVVEDLSGTDASSAKQVLCRTLAVTADKGDMTVTAGTSKKAYSPAAGVNELWLETTAAGAFSVSVANDAVEETLFQATTETGVTALLKLTFT